MCETISKLSYMLFFVIFASSCLPLLINIHFFEISEMTTHPTMTTTFESAMLSFSPGVNRPLKCLRHASVKTMNRNAMWETCGKKFTCIYNMENPYDVSTSKEQLGNLLPLCKNSAGNRIKIKFSKYYHLFSKMPGI